VPTVKQLLTAIPERSDAAALRGLNAVVQFDLSGEGGGSYHAILGDGTITVHEGPHRSADLIFAMSAADYVELATGRLSAQMAFMTGRLRLAGDMSLAEKVQPLLRVT
jgi:putative sterol carrier protein